MNSAQTIHIPAFIESDRESAGIDIARLRGEHPSDIAEILDHLIAEPARIVEYLVAIGPPAAAEAFSRMGFAAQKACLEAGRSQPLMGLIEAMSPDDRVDLLKRVDTDIREAMMPLIAQAERNEIRRLWHYAEGTAGAVMTTDYAFLPAEITAAEALERLRLQAPDKETIYYVYITDARRRLQGMVSLRDLILSKPGARLETVMQRQVISVTHDMDVSKAAGMIAKYDFIALPVTDHENRLLGIITVDDVMDIMEAESTEDFQRISAVVPFEEAYLERPLGRLFWNRFWWLAILLFTSVLSTAVMAANAEVLTRVVALSFFIPLVIGTCGNAGTQSATMVVRALAIGEIRPRDAGRIFGRELLMGMALGAALGIMALFRVFLQEHDLMLAATVGTALLATLLAANLVGALLPLLLRKLGLDPALTAGPFIATIIDAAGIAIYFQVALLLLGP